MRIFAFSLILLLGTLSAYEISLNKRFTTNVAPNKLGISVSITVRDKELNSVLNKLTEYSDFIKSFKNIEIDGGNFNTNPEYKYYKNQREKVGYRGSVYFQIKSKDDKKLKEFVSMLSAKNSDNLVDLSISSSSWQVTPKDIESKKDELRFKAIEWANSYAKKLSSRLQTECKVKSINFRGYSYPRPPIMYAKASAEQMETTSMPTPVKKDRKFSINPHIKFECK